MTRPRITEGRVPARLPVVAEGRGDAAPNHQGPRFRGPWCIQEGENYGAAADGAADPDGPGEGDGGSVEPGRTTPPEPLGYTTGTGSP